MTKIMDYLREDQKCRAVYSQYIISKSPRKSPRKSPGLPKKYQYGVCRKTRSFSTSSVGASLSFRRNDQSQVLNYAIRRPPWVKQCVCRYGNICLMLKEAIRNLMAEAIFFVPSVIYLSSSFHNSSVFFISYLLSTIRHLFIISPSVS